MWANAAIVILSATGVAFLLYFELAMFRELRCTPKKWRLSWRLHSDQRPFVNESLVPILRNEPRILDFHAPLDNSQEKQKKKEVR